MKELKSIKIIAVDHGYGNIKTANTVTPTGITAYDTEPIFSGRQRHLLPHRRGTQGIYSGQSHG